MATYFNELKGSPAGAIGKPLVRITGTTILREAVAAGCLNETENLLNETFNPVNRLPERNERPTPYFYKYGRLSEIVNILIYKCICSTRSQTAPLREHLKMPQVL